MPKFALDSAYTPTADQPKAIASLAEGIEAGERFTTLLGAPGTGKTMTMAATIEAVEKPPLLPRHHNTLPGHPRDQVRAQFPHHPVEELVSLHEPHQAEA